ncbi:MAG: trypsin-like peptidase domain-containing protein [Phycisphaerales bacterium]|nr:trypsin-like peptidase domain-containing protein [Phycisphaerales bacterium]
MSLTIQFLDGERAGQTLEFGDEVESIAIGRDPERCQVVIPADLRMVGREHCTITRVRGHYYMEMAADRRVSMNDDLMETAQTIPEDCQLEIGPDGPKLRVVTIRAGQLGSTMQQQIDTETIQRRSATPASATDVAAAQAKARKSNQTSTVAIAIAGLVLVAGGIGIYWLQEDVGGLEAEQVRTTETVGELQGTVSGLSQDVTNLGAELPAALEAARESTYLVIRRGPEGDVPFGTAWVLAPGELATNAHVADRFNQLNDDQEIIVRSMGGDREFAVTGATTHPGYGSFTDLWRDYVPVQINAAKESDPVRSAGMAADVGVLHVDEAASLGPALVMATTDGQSALHAGDPVGYVGYPLEGLALGGVNINEPMPQTQIGRITAITDYFNAPVAEDEGLLIQHSLPATGGASGSPLINARGEVVGLLSAVNFIVVGGKRIPSGVDVNFAQRSTLLEELEAPDLAERQQARTAAWEDRIEALYASGHVANRSAELEDVVAGWEQMVANQTDDVVTGSEVVDSEMFPLDSLEIDALAMGAGDTLGAAVYGRQIELDLEANKNYLLSVEGDGEVIVNLPDGDIRVVEVMDIKPMLKAIAFRAERAMTVKATIGSTERAGTVGYQLRKANAEPATPDTVAKAAMRRWLRDMSRRDGVTLEPSLVKQWQGSLKADSEGHCKASESMNLDSAGRWFIVAVCMEQANINLQLVAADGTLVAEDKEPDWYPFVSVETRGPRTMKAKIWAEGDGVKYRLFLYRADENTQQAQG